MFIRTLLALLSFGVAAQAATLPKATDYSGTVVAATDKVITVQGKVGQRNFDIYPGTVMGKGNKQKLADFKPGTPVIIVFSEEFGKYKAENIRTGTAAPAAKPVAAQPQGQGIAPIKPMPKPVSSVGTTHSKK